jgi:hypothetical protein
MALDGPYSWNKPGAVYAGPDAILARVAAFRACRLPKPEWDHFAHLTVGHHYVTAYGAAEALVRLRADIAAYNEACGVPNSDSRGYHETITAFYVHSIARYLEQVPASMPLLDQVHGLLNDALGSKAIAFAFWGKETLLSVAARRGWVDPDRRPIADLAAWPLGAEVLSPA